MKQNNERSRVVRFLGEALVVWTDRLECSSVFLLSMALSFSSLPVPSRSQSHLSFNIYHQLHSGNKNLSGSLVSFVFGSRTSTSSSRRHHSSLCCTSFERDGRNNYSPRPQSTTPAQRRLRVLCSIPEGTPLAKDPAAENKQAPQLPWILLSAGVAAAAAVVIWRFNGVRLPSVRASGQALAVQMEPGVVAAVSLEGAASFKVTLPVLGTLSLGEVTPGWVYFLLLIAAGFGLFVSEEALNVWVGASLGRLLAYGSRRELLSSLSSNAPYIVSTILWVYWGVCISDLVPFYAGKLASRRGDQLSEKLGVSKEKYDDVKGKVQRYGNLIGFVERFSIGVRNPTAFIAGVAGISPTRFFAGVCAGGLITLPLQMSVGFVLRENPVAALAGVAAVVGTWTVFPYAMAGLMSVYYLLLRKFKPSP